MILWSPMMILLSPLMMVLFKELKKVMSCEKLMVREKILGPRFILPENGVLKNGYAVLVLDEFRIAPMLVKCFDVFKVAKGVNHSRMPHPLIENEFDCFVAQG